LLQPLILLFTGDHSDKKWGGDMYKSKRAMIFLGLMTLLAPTGFAWGQAFDLAIDLNTPAADAPRYFGQPPIDIDAGLGLSFGYFGRGAFADGRPFRLGALIGRQSLKVTPQVGYAGYNYSALRFMGRGDTRLWANRTFYLSGGVGFGLTFLSDNIPCNEIFCGLPSTVVELSPNLRLSARISDTFAAFLDVRGSVYMSDQDATFPYRSGAILALGVEITAYVREDQTGSEAEHRGEF
jgi:hypothetical protein